LSGFFISCASIADLLHQVGSLTKLKALALVALVLGVGVPINWFYPMHEIRWSPYMVNHNLDLHHITVNSIGHQAMVPFASAGASYSLIHLLQQHSGGAPFRDVLVIGCGIGK
jgi:hypothetical protein